MKNYFIVLLSLAFLLSSCDSDLAMVEPLEAITTESYAFGAITGVVASDDFEVSYTYGEGPQIVEVEANENLHTYIYLVEDRGILTVRIVEDVRVRGQETLKLRLHTTQPVNSFKANRDAQINIQSSLTVENLFLQASDDAVIKGNVNADFMEVRASSAAVIDVMGEANILEANLSNHAEMENLDFMVNHIDIGMSSDAKAGFTILETIRAEVVSDARLRYRGNPDILRLETRSNGVVETVD